MQHSIFFSIKSIKTAFEHEKTRPISSPERGFKSDRSKLRGFVKFAGLLRSPSHMHRANFAPAYGAL